MGITQDCEIKWCIPLPQRPAEPRCSLPKTHGRCWLRLGSVRCPRHLNHAQTFSMPPAQPQRPCCTLQLPQKRRTQRKNPLLEASQQMRTRNGSKSFGAGSCWSRGSVHVGCCLAAAAEPDTNREGKTKWERVPALGTVGGDGANTEQKRIKPDLGMLWV